MSRPGSERRDAFANAIVALCVLIGCSAFVALISALWIAHGRAERFPMHQFGLVFGIGVGVALATSTYIYVEER